MNLKTYLEKTGMTQVAMAEKIGANQGFFNQWVHGIRPIPVGYALKIERETAGDVRMEDMHPDLDWGVLRGTAAPEQKEAT